LKQDTIAAFIRVYFDAILRCIGEGDENQSDLSFGRASVSEPSSEAKFESDSPLEVLLHGVLMICSHVIFGEYEEAGDLAVAQGEIFMNSSPGNPITMMTTFYSCVALFAKASMPRCAKKEARKLIKLAKKKHSFIKDLVKKKSPNVLHYDACLDAESAAHQGKLGKAEMHYQHAITLAARGGFVQDAGLACERYAHLLRYIYKPAHEKDALFQLDRAIGFYSSWESPKKVTMLKELRLKYSSSAKRSSSAHKLRTRDAVDMFSSAKKPSYKDLVGSVKKPLSNVSRSAKELQT
jgi:hypothetical protein